MAAAAWLISDGMLYQAEYASRLAPAGGALIRAEDGRTISVLYLPNPAARYTLWYFHGNAESLGDIEPRLRALRDLGFAVFAYDYPGYGLSSGRPSEARIYASTQAALAYLRQAHGVTPDRILAFGRSMGGGPAVELAVRQPVAGLILQSAFTSVYRVMTRWPLLPFDKFENLRKIPRVRCPVLVMHGKEDHLVTFDHGEALFAAAPAPKWHLWSELAGHNDFEVFDGDAYRAALRGLADGIIKGTPTAAQ